MMHLDGSDDGRSALLTARAREYERLADHYAGLVGRCAHLRGILDDRLAVCQATRERLTAAPPPR
jgi:hypothetical protein